MNARRFARLQASFADQPDIHAEIAVLLAALEPEPKRELPVLPVAAAVAVIVGSAGQALAEQAQHVVVAGESLYRIAARDLGSGSRWPEIARLNHLTDPARIMVGQVLQLPALSAGATSLGRAAGPAAAASRFPVEIVPAGVVVERLPGRSQAELPAQVRPTSPSRDTSAANDFQLQPVLSVPGPASAPGPHRSLGWTGLDGLAFLAGAAASLRLLGRSWRRQPAPTLRIVTAPVVEETVSSSFWTTPPGSWDLQNLTASAS